MKEGIILKGVGGVYDVQTEAGLVSCSLRGRLRLEEQRVLVGDRVEVSWDNGQGVVERVLPRKTELIRPAIANVNLVLAVFAVERPKPSLLLLDRILVHAELAGLSAAVVINKAELNKKKAQKLQEMYAGIPYPTLVTSAKEGLYLDEVANLLKDQISTLAGPSGVGKSSLLNALFPDLELETGKISARVQRGRHTTRSVQLLPLPFGGYVADTPGFSQLSMEPDLQAELQYAFPEMEKYIGQCQFRGCLHKHEPNCAVKDAVQVGKILEHRYEHYLLFLEEAAPLY